MCGNWVNFTSGPIDRQQFDLSSCELGGTFTIDSLAVTTLANSPACPQCSADFDGNGGVDGGDHAAFFAAFEFGGC